MTNALTGPQPFFYLWILKKNALTTKFEPHECVIFAQSTKIGTHENKTIHSILFLSLNVVFDIHRNTIWTKPKRLSLLKGKKNFLKAILHQFSNK